MNLFWTGIILAVLACMLLIGTSFAQQTNCTRLPGGRVICTTGPGPQPGSRGRTCTTTSPPGLPTVTTCSDT